MVEIEEFKSKYEIVEKIVVGGASEKFVLGEGTYGKVYKARRLATNETVAVKEMKVDDSEDGVPSTAIREIALLKEAHHENVVQLIEVFCKPGKLALVFELLDSDVKKLMKERNGRLAPSVVKHFAQQMLSGMEFLHSHRIIHRDIKPQNLLVNRSTEKLKIADFGLARAYSIPMPEYTHEVVTVWYRPLEILLGGKLYSLPVDLWSCGCVLAEMATGGPLFPGDSEIDTIFKIFQKLGTPSEQRWNGIGSLPDFKPTFPKWPKKPWTSIRNTASQVGETGIDLLEGLLEYDPRKRTSARAALAHPYIADMTDVPNV